MWFLVVFIVALVVAVAMTPKPQDRPPAGLGDVTAPTASEGRCITMLFGTRILSGPNVVWYGNFSAIPVKKSGGKK